MIWCWAISDFAEDTTKICHLAQPRMNLHTRLHIFGRFRFRARRAIGQSYRMHGSYTCRAKEERNRVR